jgi:hypothetical protein
VLQIACLRACVRARAFTHGLGRLTSSYNSRLVRQSKVLFLAINVAGLPHRGHEASAGVGSVSNKRCQRQQFASSACVASML